MRERLRFPFAALLLALGLGLSACGDDAAEDAGEAVEEAGEEAGEAVEDAGEAAEDAADQQ